MKKIIRLTESELHNIVENSVSKILREYDESLLLQTIAQSLVQQSPLTVQEGENETDVELQGDSFAHIVFSVQCNPYMMKGMKSSSYDVPDDADEVVDDVQVEVMEVNFCKEGDCIQIQDNGIIKKGLENIIDVDYSNMDIPTEKDFFA